MIKRKLNVGVIGGSLSGLFSAMALQSCNHNVTIFEKISGSRRGAGIGVTPPLLDFVDQLNILTSNNSFVKSIQTCSMSTDGTLSCNIHEDTPRYHTTWDVLYQNCLQTFISNKNNGSGNRDIIENKCLEKITYDDNKDSMKLKFTDNTVFDCDLVIGADGIGSQTRKYVSHLHIKHDNDRDHNNNTDANMNYAGYVTPNELQDSKILYDKNNKHHLYSMSRGFLHDIVINDLKQKVAPKLLPNIFVQLVHLTKEPFFQVIYDYQCDKMVNIFNGTAGIALVGDAAFVLRPHTGRGTSKAAGDALALKKWFGQYSNGDISFSDALNGYNNERHPIGIQCSHESIQLGNKVVLQTNQRPELSNQYIKPSV